VNWARANTLDVMNSKSLDSVVLRYVSLGLLFTAVIIGLYLVRGVLPVFIISGVIAFALEPLLQRLERTNHSRPRAVGFVFLVYVLLLLILFWLLAGAVKQGQEFMAGAPQKFGQIQNIVQNAQTRLDSLRVPAAVKEGIKSTIKGLNATAGGSVLRVVQDAGPKILAGTGSLLLNVFLITLISFGLMLEAQHIKGRLLMLVPALYRRDAIRLATSINGLLGRYVRGQLIVCATFGALCTIAFEVLNHVYGMQYPLVLGAFAACIYILPYFGLFMVIIVSVLTAYLTANPGQGLVCAGVTLACCVVFNITVDYGVAPRVLGRGVGLHPLMVIFALLCGFELGGPLGSIAAVPIFASLRVLAIYLFPQLVTPLPDEFAEKPAEKKPHSAVTELSRRVADAEEKSATPKPLNGSVTGQSEIVNRILDLDEK